MSQKEVLQSTLSQHTPEGINNVSGLTTLTMTTTTRHSQKGPFSPQYCCYGFPENEINYGFDFDPETSVVIHHAASGSGNDQIRCGSLYKLVERLTDDRQQDLNHRFVFLLTYHSFTTARQFLKLLAERYFIPLPHNITPSECAFFSKCQCSTL
jgi:hypothetical protein